MDVKHVNPFIASFLEIMPQIGFSTVRKRNLSVKGQDLICSGVIIIVGMIGSIKGNIVYSLDTEDAKRIASTMMMGMPVEELNEMSKSALSELSNMLTANAATGFSKIGIPIDISTPTLMYGQDIAIKMSAHQVLCVQLLADDIPIDINIAFEN